MPAAPDSGGGFNVLQSLQNALTTLLNYVPNVIGALLVLLIGYIIARLLRAGISRLLGKLRVDEKLTHGKGGEYVARFSPQGKPSQLVGLVVQYVLMVFVIVSAVGTLNIPAVTGFVTLVLSYLPNVLAALLIFLVAAAIAAAVGGLVHRTMGDTPTGRVVRSAAPTLVMAIAVFMILNQLGIAETIVTATYIALIGAVALGSALAFGLGGRDAAADLINSGYRKAQQQSDQVQRDLQTGQHHAQAEAQQFTDQDTPQYAPTGQGAGAYPAGAAEPPTARVNQPDPYGEDGPRATPPTREQPTLTGPSSPQGVQW
jgi:small-conductance mechanosensitive channel